MATRMKRKIEKDSHSDGEKKRKTEERKCYFTYGNDHTEEFLFNKRESLLHAYKRVQSPIPCDEPLFSYNGEPLVRDFVLTAESIGNVFVVHKNYGDRELYLFWWGVNRIKKKNGCLVHNCGFMIGLEKHVYIRKCYSKLWKSNVWPYLQSEAQSSKVLHVTGTPGIGKTTFVLYILYKLKKLAKRVTFIHGSELYVFDDHPRVLYDRQQQVSFIASKEGEVFISDPGDSISPAHLEICSRIDKRRNLYIILSSPDKQHIEHVQHYPLIKCVMPVWSWEEITACNEMIYKKTESEVKDIYIRFGPTPRACFTFTSQDLDLRFNKFSKDPNMASKMSKALEYDEFISGEMEQYMIMNDKGKRDWATYYVKEQLLSPHVQMFTSSKGQMELLRSCGSYLGGIN